MKALHPTVDAWIESLANVSLPSLSTHAARLQLLDSDVTVQALCQGLQADLPLALTIVLNAKRQLGGRIELQGLAHAVSALGVDRVQKMIRQHTRVQYDKRLPAHRAFLQALSISYFAAQLVDRWERNKQTGGGEALLWTTLLLGVVRWRLPLVSLEAHRHIESQIAQGRSRLTAEKALFGCSTDRLTHRLMIDSGIEKDTQHLMHFTVPVGRFEEASRYAWQDDLAADVPLPIAAWLRKHATLCLTGHLLAWSCADNWRSPRTNILYRVVSVQLGWSIDKVVASVHRHAAQSSRDFFPQTVIHPIAERLFWQMESQRNVMAASAVSNSAAQQCCLTVSADNTSSCDHGANIDHVLQVYTQACRSGQFLNRKDLMAATLELLDVHLGLSRILVFFKLHGVSQLQPQVVHGFSDSFLNNKPTTRIDAKDYIARLCLKAGALQVSEKNLANVCRRLPAELSVEVLSSGLFLSSIRVDERSIGVVWADSGQEDGTVLTTVHYHKFKKLIADFSYAFGVLVKKSSAR